MFGSNRLVDAAQDGLLDIVKSEIDKGVDVNKPGFFKITALMGAASNGHNDVVRFLLEQSETDVDVLNAGGTTALMTAARGGHLETVKVLLDDPRCDVNCLGKWGGTALMNAAGFGHMDVVEELLKHDNISLAETYTDRNHSPITIAKQNGHDHIAKVLEAFEVSRMQRSNRPRRPKNLGM